MQQEIHLRSSEDLPTPDIISNCTLDSDSAHVTNAGLIHIFKIPQIGEYHWNFKIWSNVVLLNKFHSLTTRNYLLERVPVPPMDMSIFPYRENEVWSVDCIINYIESVSLCIGSPEKVLSRIDNSESITQLRDDNQQSILGLNLTFLPNLPIIKASLQNTPVYLVIKFAGKPPMKYNISFDVGLIGNETIQEQLRTYIFTIPGVIVQEGIPKNYTFKYGDGNLVLI